MGRSHKKSRPKAAGYRFKILLVVNRFGQAGLMHVSIAKRGFRKIYRSVNQHFDFSAQMPEQTIKTPLFPYEPQPKLIVDLGMNDGSDTFFYLKKGFNVVAIEANPALIDQASRRFGRFISADTLRVLNCGIADVASEPLDFYINHTRSEWSSFVKDIGSRGNKGFSVKKIAMLPIADLFAEFGTPYYLKIDIEGYDQRIIDALAPLPYRPRFISAEESGAGMVDSLNAIGATAFKLVDQTSHPSIKLPDPPLEGRFCRHYFVSGSSGPFGEETPDGWMSYKDFREMYVANYRSEDGVWVSSSKGWFDIHAKF
jgi:FkbM family methyltransferase